MNTHKDNWPFRVKTVSSNCLTILKFVFECAWSHENFPTRAPSEGNGSCEYETIVGTSKATIVSRKLLPRAHLSGFSLWVGEQVQLSPRLGRRRTASYTRGGLILHRVAPSTPQTHPNRCERVKHWLWRCGKTNCLVSNVVNTKEFNVTILTKKIWMWYFLIFSFI